jgi:hypothetical protein
LTFSLVPDLLLPRALVPGTLQAASEMALLSVESAKTGSGGSRDNLPASSLLQRRNKGNCTEISARKPDNAPGLHNFAHRIPGRKKFAAYLSLIFAKLTNDD